MRKDGVIIVADVGSTHMQRRNYVKECIEKCKKAGVDVVKFQLFPNREEYTKCGNQYLTFDEFNWAVSYGRKFKIPVTASVFGQIEAEFLLKKDLPFIKMAYSQQENRKLIRGMCEQGRTVVVTSDVWRVGELPDYPNLIKLYTNTVNGATEYPSKWVTNFEGLFPHMFDGFSDHSLGMGESVRAVQHGAKWVEKHIKLPYRDIVCPDAKFALSTEELPSFVQKIRESSVNREG